MGGTTVAVCPGSPGNRCNAQQKVTMTLVEGENYTTRRLLQMRVWQHELLQHEPDWQGCRP